MSGLLGSVTAIVLGVVFCGVLLVVAGAALVMGLNKRARPTTLSATPPAPPVQEKIEHPTASEERSSTPPPPPAGPTDG